MTVAARPQRPIPTVQANPALLQEGDMIYPDIRGPRPWAKGDVPAFRVLNRQRVRGGWWIDLDGRCLLLVPDGGKVRTQRRPNPTLPMDPEAADAIFARYREPRYV
jgi:hypothetical protein